jgi:hypothetical protein
MLYIMPNLMLRRSLDLPEIRGEKVYLLSLISFGKWTSQDQYRRHNISMIACLTKWLQAFVTLS